MQLNSHTGYIFYSLWVVPEEEYGRAELRRNCKTSKRENLQSTYNQRHSS